MNIDDLDWQLRNYGGVLPRLVDALLGRGELELVVRAAQDRADWFCARAAADRLCAAGEPERAWAVLEPFARTGWAPAVSAAVTALAAAGRAGEALALAERCGADGEERDRVRAEALAHAGQLDEALAVLDPHVTKARLLTALVELTDGRGRDEAVLARLAQVADAGLYDSWRAHILHAQVLERAGRPEQAIRTLGAVVAARRIVPQNTVTAYAELLARHGRLPELRDLVLGGHAYAAQQAYVDALRDAGRAAEAEAFLRERLDSASTSAAARALLVELLLALHRVDEAIAAAHGTFEDEDLSLLQPVVLELAELGLHERALALLTDRSPEFLDRNARWVPSNRQWLLSELGRTDEAVADLMATPGLSPAERAAAHAGLLAAGARFDEAAALLPACGTRAPEAARNIAGHLIDHGRAAEALALLPDVPSQRAAEQERRPAATGGGWSKA
ncbi:hypothetical protein ACIQF6_31170 [Kitasatospora sp. NPDC092948]|uniref:hypothetical protein n=1 Tax=Kitasatospora sp. NPDC092948 TaxID=3364088 RepID=UPI0037FA1470